MKRTTGLLSFFLLAFAAVAGAADVGERAIFAVAGSTTGANNSAFKTSLQMANPTDEVMEGELVLRPMGSVAQPFRMTYRLAPHEVVGYRDFVAAFLQLTQVAFGSLDIVPSKGATPIAMLRVYNDSGTNGTAGMSVDPAKADQIIRAGQSTALIVDNYRGKDRVNIGIRTVDGPARIRGTLRTNRLPIAQFEREYPADYFEQVSLAQFVGAPFDANVAGSLAIEVLSGAIVTYSASTNNLSNDPIISLGDRIVDRPGIDAPTDYTVPIFGAAVGQNGSRFDSLLSFYNPHETIIMVKITFHQLDVPNDVTLPTAVVGVQPFVTTAVNNASISGWYDKPAAFGSLDFSLVGDMASRVRINSMNGPRGETGLAMPLVSHSEALMAGQRGLLFTPFDFESYRMNVGIRSLKDGATVRASCVARDGGLLAKTHVFPANLIRQISVGDLCGGAAAPNTAVELTVDAGRAIVYGATTDNVSQDPTFQLARRY